MGRYEAVEMRLRVAVLAVCAIEASSYVLVEACWRMIRARVARAALAVSGTDR